MINYSYVTNPGLQRNQNEDSLSIGKKAIYNTTKKGKGSMLFDKGFFAVFDGVGGSSNGNIASESASKYFSSHSDVSRIANITDIYDLMEDTNNFLNETKFCLDAEGIMTTSVGVFINKKQIMIFNIGDSPAYLYDGEIKKMCFEDTLRNQYIKNKNYTIEEIDNMDIEHMITNCLGRRQFVKEDTHCYIVDREKGKRNVVLLMSDGISDLVDKNEMKDIIEQRQDLDSIVSQIEDLVLDRGAHDNYTLIVIEVK